MKSQAIGLGLLLCLLLAGRGRAQTFFEDTGDLPSSASILASPLMGDYDNDGRMDMVYWRYDGITAKVILAHNEGHGRFADASHLLPPDLLGYFLWGDWDNDGDLDLLEKIFAPTPVYHLWRNERGRLVDERLATINADPDSADVGGIPALGIQFHPQVLQMGLVLFAVHLGGVGPKLPVFFPLFVLHHVDAVELEVGVGSEHRDAPHVKPMPGGTKEVEPHRAAQDDQHRKEDPPETACLGHADSRPS